MVVFPKDHKKQLHFYIKVSLALIVMIACVTTFIIGMALHNSDNPDCMCPVCLMNNVDENEYIYNRYFPLISIFCLLLVLLPVYILHHRQTNKRKRP